MEAKSWPVAHPSCLGWCPKITSSASWCFLALLGAELASEGLRDQSNIMSRLWQEKAHHCTTSTGRLSTGGGGGGRRRHSSLFPSENLSYVLTRNPLMWNWLERNLDRSQVIHQNPEWIWLAKPWSVGPRLLYTCLRSHLAWNEWFPLGTSGPVLPNESSSQERVLGISAAVVNFNFFNCWGEAYKHYINTINTYNTNLTNILSIFLPTMTGRICYTQ